MLIAYGPELGLIIGMLPLPYAPKKMYADEVPLLFGRNS